MSLNSSLPLPSLSSAASAPINWGTLQPIGVELDAIAAAWTSSGLMVPLTVTPSPTLSPSSTTEPEPTPVPTVTITETIQPSFSGTVELDGTQYLGLTTGLVLLLTLVAALLVSQMRRP